MPPENKVWNMCGIAGQISWRSGMTKAQLRHETDQMLRALSHRGPDDSQIWMGENTPVVFGHRRLSILDLSPAGRQPMVSDEGRYILSYNGEIFNFQQIRQELEKKNHRFIGTSDSEVLLHAVQEWGVYEATQASNGLFAFAVWDRHLRRLSLVRDRMGKKPLYYGRMNGAFFFASELKALRTHPAFDGQIDRSMLSAFMRLKCVPGPHSIYQEISQVAPGTMVDFDLVEGVLGPPQEKTFWQVETALIDGLRSPLASPDLIFPRLDDLLRDAVAKRMLADVPLGAFLSGGIDSSLVVAMMQAQSERAVKTFTIGFEDKERDESDDARAVAKYLGTDHTQLYASPEDALNLVPELASIYDEPFADASQIPTLLVTKLASDHLTVALSGDGGDELFGGYGRYLFLKKLWQRIRYMPNPLQKLSSYAADGLLHGLNLLPNGARSLAPVEVRKRWSTDRISYLSEALTIQDPAQFYDHSLARWRRDPHVVLDQDHREWERVLPGHLPPMSPLDTWMYLDMKRYLPDDILVKVDRASMASSLEVRAPLLDYRLVELAWRIPQKWKAKDGTGKWILRQLAYQYIPRALLDRPKRGFGVPMSSWLRGKLRPWAEELLSTHRLNNDGFFATNVVRHRWNQHLDGTRDWSPDLWCVLMFQAWLDTTR